MRKSAPISGPLFLIGAYFFALIAVVRGYLWVFPEHSIYAPFGGIGNLMPGGSDAEIIATFTQTSSSASLDGFSLTLAIIGTVFIITPVSWVYFITTRAKQIDRSFAQTIVVLPVVVAGISMIVQHSLALAFSLAGVVAAVRFRFALEEPAHALYVFVAIAIGLAAGIGALEVAYVLSLGFVLVNLVLWKLDYGADLTTPFFAFLTGRGRDDNDL
jgi:hypothetical protein